MPLLLGCLLGLAQGMRHALEPDHVTAVSTLVAGQDTGKRIVSFAAVWSLGHALTLLVVGGALAVFHAEMPPAVGDVLELLVAGMLVLLGARAIARARRTTPRRGHANAHAHPHASARPRADGVARSPLLGVGIVHGLAGSGALAALAMASFPSVASGLLFIAVYGVGAGVGMALLAAVAVVPLARVARSPRASALLMVSAGAFSIALGVYWGWPIAKRFAAERSAVAAPTWPAPRSGAGANARAAAPANAQPNQ